MTMKERFESAKPMIGGAVVGAVAITIVAFAANWVVMADTMEENVKASRINALAQVCEEMARDHWLVQGRTLEGLSGYRNEERSELALRFVPASTGEESDIKSEVADACSKLLRS